MEKRISPIKGGYNVTFWIKSFLNGYGKFCIVCKTEEEAHDAAYDIYSFHGCKYLKLNRCGRVGKDVKIISYDRYKQDYRWF